MYRREPEAARILFVEQFHLSRLHIPGKVDGKLPLAHRYGQRRLDITIGGNGVTQANGEIATVYFTIDAGYNGLLVNPWGSGAFSGLQLRQVPEPTTLALCGMVGLAMIWRRNRAK